MGGGRWQCCCQEGGVVTVLPNQDAGKEAVRVCYDPPRNLPQQRLIKDLHISKP